jgi:hypothetical protein
VKTTNNNQWKIETRWSDIRGFGFVEALCAHGIGHHNGTHGCDGCCSNMPQDIANQISKD